MVLCLPQIRMLKPSPQRDGIWRWGLWEMIRLKGLQLINRIYGLIKAHVGFPHGLVVKNPPVNAGNTGRLIPVFQQAWSLGQEDPLEMEMATH